MAEASTILVSGATGLVGGAVCDALAGRGHTVRTLSRSSGGDFRWDPEKGELDAGALDGVTHVVHLAGEPIAQRWTDAAKGRILRSRVRGTALLARQMLKHDPKPALVCASGTHFYGYSRDEPVDETDASGSGFLAEVCREWEAAAKPLDASPGGRVVYVRTGIVLSAAGGALAKMLPPFRAGLGGRVGSGAQRMSWIGLEDLARVYVRAVEDASIGGPLNAVAPAPATNAAFVKTLGKVLGRPAALPLPAFAVNWMFGEMGRETLLSDLAVRPSRLEDFGFEWKSPDLRTALARAMDDAGKKEA